MFSRAGRRVHSWDRREVFWPMDRSAHCNRISRVPVCIAYQHRIDFFPGREYDLIAPGPFPNLRLHRPPPHTASAACFNLPGHPGAPTLSPRPVVPSRALTPTGAAARHLHHGRDSGWSRGPCGLSQPPLGSGGFGARSRGRRRGGRCGGPCGFPAEARGRRTSAKGRKGLGGLGLGSRLSVIPLAR